jgi:hypothetical protein
MLHMGFVHAVLVDLAERRDGPSWDRERRLADGLIETSSRFDGAFEPADEDAVVAPKEPPRRGGSGGLLAGFGDMLGRMVPARQSS